MGRLKLRRRSLVRKLAAWTAPLVLAVALLIGWHSVAKADTPPTATELSAYLAGNQLSVGSQTVGDNQQIYYNFTNHRQIFISSAPYNHLQPMASGEYIVWTGQSGSGSQIYQYDALTGALLQLTSAGTNQNPSAYRNTVTWESWADNHWRVMYYDGFSVQQVSDDQHSAIRASSNGQQVIYAEQLGPNDWHTMVYYQNTGTATELKRGSEADTAFPQFASDGSITTDVIKYYN